MEGPYVEYVDSTFSLLLQLMAQCVQHIDCLPLRFGKLAGVNEAKAVQCDWFDLALGKDAEDCVCFVVAITRVCERRIFILKPWLLLCISR